ncbi:MAG TPA: alpha/beta family hydrolase [Acidisarcina sp.]
MTTNTPTAILRSIDSLAGPAGRLEALLNAGQPTAPCAVLACHPHPLGGGTIHNKVIYNAMKTFHGYGLPVLRFNFRGTGLSEGVHDDGRGEQDDVRAALDWLDREFHLPVLFVGFSFGAYVGLQACCGDARVRGLVALGVPVHAEGRDYRYDFLASCAQPKLFISGAEDQYGPSPALKAIIAAAAPPAELVLIPGADHFFAGKIPEMQQAIQAWLGNQLPNLKAPSA